MRLLAQIGMKLDILDDAEFLLESVLVFAPDYDLARSEYATVLSKRHKHARAIEEIKKLRARDAENRSYRTLHANALIGLGDHEGALQMYRDLLVDAPQSEELHLSIAHALKTIGRQAEAVDSYRAAATARPSFGDAYWSLANLKTYRFTPDEIARMRAQEAAAGIACPIDTTCVSPLARPSRIWASTRSHSTTTSAATHSRRARAGKRPS